MKKIPKESKLYNSFPLFTDILFLGLLWLLCSLPLVTLGSSCCAVYHAMVKSVRHGRGHAGSTFFAAFRSNFKNSLKLWLLFLLLIGLWAANLFVTVFAAGESANLLSTPGFWLIIPVMIPLVWVFAYTSRFDNSPWDTLKFSLLLGIKNLGRTVMLLLTAAAFFTLGWIFPVLIPLLPGFCCLLMSYQTEPVFRAITLQMESDSNDDKWYNE